MKKILIKTTLAALVLGISTSQSFSQTLQGYECKYTIDSKRFNTTYETRGHIITSIETGDVYQPNVLGLPFADISGTYPEANIYTYQLSSGVKRLFLQLIDRSDPTFNDGKIVNVGTDKVTVEHEVAGEFPAMLKLSCTILMM